MKAYSPAVIIDDFPGHDSPPGEWQNYLDLLTPERVPNAKERARLRRDVRRGLERSLDPERKGLNDPIHPWGIPAGRGLNPICPAN